MFRIHICGLFFCLFLLSCKSGQKEIIFNAADTSQILSNIFNSEQIRTDIPENTDTIFVLKEKNLYNSSWPQHVNKLAIKYIEDTEHSRFLNKPWLEKYDKRWRISLVRFVLDQDTGKVSLYNYNTVTGYRFLLNKTHLGWSIVDYGSTVE